MADFTIGPWTPTPPTAAGTRAQTQAERDLFGTLPVVNELHPIETALREPLRERQSDLVDVLGLTQTQQQARHRDYADLIRRTGLEPLTVGARLYDLMTDADLEDARGTAVDAAQVTAWSEESRRQLRVTYGAKEAEDLLQRVQKFTREHPKLAAIVQRRGIGSRPDVVQLLVDEVRRRGYR